MIYVSVLGKVDPTPKYGAIHRRHVVVEDLTGPSSDVSIDAGGTNTVTLNIASEVPRNVQYAGVESISGVPDGVYISDISFDKTNKTLTITFYNSGTASATISANSLTVRVVSIA